MSESDLRVQWKGPWTKELSPEQRRGHSQQGALSFAVPGMGLYS